MNKFWFSIVAFCLVLSSCSKDINIDDEKEIDDPTRIEVTNGLLTRSVAQQGGLDLGCFVIQYPFTLVELINNANVEHLITRDDDFNNLFADSIEILDFKYPITIEKDGVTSQVDNIDALSEEFSGCTPEGWSDNEFPAYLIDNDNSCYTLSFPVGLKKEDGTKVSATDKDNFNELISTEFYLFDFPITLKDEASTNHVVNDATELFTLLASCGGIIVDSTFDCGGIDFTIACYEVKFPVSVIKNDALGSKVIVATKEDFNQLALEGNIKDIAYPLTLVKNDGTEILISREEELDEAIADCFGGGGPGDIPGVFLLYAGSIDSSQVQACFTVNYPIVVTITGGGQVVNQTLNNPIDLLNLLQVSATSVITLNYPITVVKNKNNQTVVLNKDEDLLNLVLNCE